MEKRVFLVSITAVLFFGFIASNIDETVTGMQIIQSPLVTPTPPNVAPPRTLWTFNTNTSANVRGLRKIKDVDNDGIDDIVAASSEYGHTVYLLSGKNGNLIWSYAPPSSKTGINYVTILKDVNNDGYEDIGAGVNGIINDPAKFQAISGLDGSLIWSHTTAKPSASDIETIPDVTGDGINDVIGATPSDNTAGKVSIINGVTGALVWERHSINAVIDVEPIKDVNGDNKHDVLIGTVGVNKAYTSILSGHDGSILWTHGPDFGGFVEPIKQLGGNKQDVIGAPRDYENTGLYRLNGNGGNVIWQFTGTCNNSEWMGTVETIKDVNNDGIRDVLAASSGVGSGCKTKVYAIDGATGQPIWGVKGTIIPVGGSPRLLMINDVNNNGKKDVLSVETNFPAWKVVVREGSTGKSLWSKPFSSSVHSGLAAGDLNGNGVQDVIVGGNDIVYAFEGKP